MLERLLSKIHRATVTDANIDYEGSITISENLVQKAKMHPLSKSPCSGYSIMGRGLRHT